MNIFCSPLSIWRRTVFLSKNLQYFIRLAHNTDSVKKHSNIVNTTR